MSPRKLRWAAFSATAILLIALATLSWNYWKPASQTADTTGTSAVGGAAPWFSIAILPFAAPSGGAAEAQLADSLTRDLTVAFGRIRWARVVSYALASTYKGKAIDARAVGRELNVRYLVEGEVRSAGEGFITDIQLIDTGAATQAWSNRLKLERGSAEQDPGALVTPLIQQLRAALFAAERRRIGTQSAIHPDAMELVLRADNVLDQETDPLKGALEARKLYDEALRLDPNLAEALLGRGWTLDVELDLNRGAARDHLVQELDDLSMRAVAREGDDPRMWWLRSRALAWQWRWEAALEANSKEQSLDRTRAGPIAQRAWLMGMLGKPAEALPLVDQALALDPLDVGFALRLRCRSYLRSAATRMRLTPVKRRDPSRMAGPCIFSSLQPMRTRVKSPRPKLQRRHCCGAARASRSLISKQADTRMNRPGYNRARPTSSPVYARLEFPNVIRPRPGVRFQSCCNVASRDSEISATGLGK